MTNLLTERLTAQGYIKSNYPDYVRPGGGYALCFVYTYAKLCAMVWEAPCGLMKKGGYWLVGSCSYGGATYAAENDNPLGACPYYDRTPCPYRLQWAVERKFWGETCVYHETVKPYNYENSVEKLEDEAKSIEREAREQLWQENPYARLCHCCHWNDRDRRFVKRFDIFQCAHNPCENSVCAITRKPLDKEQVYIVYDVLKEWHTKQGLIEETRREIIKGIKAIGNSCDRTIGELWINAHGGEISPPRIKLSQDEHRQLHWQSNKLEHPELDWEPPEGYEIYEFKATAVNLRLKKKGTRGRDLAQDLSDIAEGIKVTHESDNQKASAQQKRERKVARQEQKKQKNRKKRRAKALQYLAEKPYSELEDMEQWLVDKFLTPEEIEAAQRGDESPEQLSLFGAVYEEV